jgi:hypothetical protein
MMVMPVSDEVQQSRLIGGLRAGLRNRWQRRCGAGSGKGDGGGQ